MPTTFVPDDPTQPPMTVGIGFWVYLLDEGLGLAFDVVQGPGEIGAATYLYSGDVNPTSHDGFHVDAAQAAVLAKLLRSQAHAEDQRDEVLAQRSQTTLRWLEAHGHLRSVRLPGPPELRELLLPFADWCERSGGFRVT